jgi:hypothetical protein
METPQVAPARPRPMRPDLPLGMEPAAIRRRIVAL